MPFQDAVNTLVQLNARQALSFLLFEAKVIHYDCLLRERERRCRDCTMPCRWAGSPQSVTQRPIHGRLFTIIE